MRFDFSGRRLFLCYPLVGGPSMVVEICANGSLPDAELAAAILFLQQFGMVPKGAEFLFKGELVKTGHKTNLPNIRDKTGDETVSMRVLFTGDELRLGSVLERAIQTKFIVGKQGLPERLDHVCIPFGGLKRSSQWLPGVVSHARELGLKVRLLHSDRGLVSREIVKFADWFRLDSVKQKLNHWHTEEIQKTFKPLLDHFSDIEIKAGVGTLKTVLQQEDPQRMFLMGSLTSGYHLPHHHHGLNYGMLLKKTGACGYFLAEGHGNG